MDRQSSIRSAWRNLKDAHGDIFTIFRDLKWLIAISFIACLALYLPDQVRELYRVSAANGGSTALKQLAAIFAIGLSIWFGAFQIATETSNRIDATKPWTVWFLRIFANCPRDAADVGSHRGPAPIATCLKWIRGRRPRGASPSWEYLSNSRERLE